MEDYCSYARRRALTRGTAENPEISLALDNLDVDVRIVKGLGDFGNDIVDIASCEAVVDKDDAVSMSGYGADSLRKRSNSKRWSDSVCRRRKKQVLCVASGQVSIAFLPTVRETCRKTTKSSGNTKARRGVHIHFRNRIIRKSLTVKVQSCCQKSPIVEIGDEDGSSC